MFQGIIDDAVAAVAAYGRGDIVTAIAHANCALYYESALALPHEKEKAAPSLYVASEIIRECAT